jgi:RNA polymerase sigma-70 factor (ECF subfamily)
LKVIYLKKRTVNENGNFVAALLEEHGSALRRFIRVRSNLNEHDCEDIMQMVSERLLKLDDLQQILEGRLDTVRNYLFQIAVNLLIDKKRRDDVRHRDHHVSEQDVTILSSLDSPERKLEGKYRLRQTQDILNSIKLSYKQAFLLSRVDGKSYREISDILGVSVSTVEKYISKALLAVRKGVVNDD